jgi:hypothetical protein
VSQTLLDTRANSTPRKLLARVEFIAADSDRALSQVQVHSKEFITDRVRRGEWRGRQADGTLSLAKKLMVE